ncbi:MAG: hypothetical protein QOJ22_1201 [Thermoleophilaceae bacterium]|jgi:uncharacterized membrane protein|nr:hypothetical protein [Thermoleophilaceae bacterium]
MRAWVVVALTASSSPALAFDLKAQGEARPGRAAVDAGLEWIATGIEIAGVGIIVVGALAATAVFLYGGFTAVGWPAAYRRYRANLGRGILLGLELLVAADIIGTVAVTPSLQNLAVLGLIVLIRTFLSVSLEVEIEGRWPWQRAAAEAAGNGGRAGERL